MEKFTSFIDNNGGVLLLHFKELIDNINRTELNMIHKTLFLLILRETDKEIIDLMEKEGLSGILISWFDEAYVDRNTVFLAEMLTTFKYVSSAKFFSDKIRDLAQLKDPLIAKPAHELLLKWNSEKRAQQLLKNKIELESKKPARRRTVKIKNTVLRTAGIEEKYTEEEMENVSLPSNRKSLKRKLTHLNLSEIDGILPIKSLKKKRVTWAPPDKLKKVLIYESVELECDGGKEHTRKCSKVNYAIGMKPEGDKVNLKINGTSSRNIAVTKRINNVNNTEKASETRNEEETNTSSISVAEHNFFNDVEMSKNKNASATIGVECSPKLMSSNDNKENKKISEKQEAINTLANSFISQIENLSTTDQKKLDLAKCLYSAISESSKSLGIEINKLTSVDAHRALASISAKKHLDSTWILPPN